ncbi:chromosome segregation protein Csm1/Pcs1-domain-containing protein [Triangularia verruculosa]|uniref:Chromosome segregation protein Csm1/Pcs1-domain-containing protein n=1 Tax=Triangularia verruculosa TaxID=2587418 RepID=A0AAN7B033_9PEZI|nr:chromosome segregation protein Csm1/Pcs1-domain-containing protein [Triangularia verruculosa]
MRRTKIRSQLLELVDSDSEDGLGGNSFGVVARTSSSTATANIGRPRKLNSKTATTTPAATMPPKKRGAAAKAAAASKVTKPEPKKTATTRRAAGRVAAAVEKEVLGDTPANTPAKSAPAGRGRGRRAAAATPVEEPEEDTEMADTTTASETRATRGRPKKAAAGRKGSAASSPDETAEIPETQPSALEPGTPISDNETQPTIPPPQPRGLSVSPQKKRPSVSTSSSSEADLRRRLGDLTKSHSSLESKYNSLRDLTIPQAEKTFDAYRKQSESKSKLADSLIASLKAELATTKQCSGVIPSLQNDLSAAQAQIAKFEAQVAELNKTIADQKTEIKALNMKLTAARNAEAAANSRSATIQVPGSAMKKTLGIGPRGAGQQAQEATLSAQRKEDLYADLTGLIVRGVNVQTDAVEFDCLQTGRNGTLHFKLTMSSGDGDESQCEYNPMLDTNRDRALIEVLPEFLVDEIAFPRTQAGRFYQRIMKALNESS